MAVPLLSASAAGVLTRLATTRSACLAAARLLVLVSAPRWLSGWVSWPRWTRSGN